MGDQSTGHIAQGAIHYNQPLIFTLGLRACVCRVQQILMTPGSVWVSTQAFLWTLLHCLL